MTRNLVLYAVLAGTGEKLDQRKPLASYAPDTPLLPAVVSAKIGDAMREAERSGSPVPSFKLVSEEREADEGEKFVVRASFCELDPFTGREVGPACNTLADVFKKREAVAAAPAPETPEEKAKREAAEKSAALSV